MAEIPIASHLKIRHYLLRLVREAGGQIQSIPSERVLADKLSVSRSTVRKAIQQLVEEGYLVARHGLGTFIDPTSWYSVSYVNNDRLRLALVLGDGQTAYYSPSIGKTLSAFAESFSQREADFTLVSFNSGSHYNFDDLTVNGPAGVVWFRPPLAALELLRELVVRGFHAVVVDSPYQVEGLHSVATDFAAVGRLAAQTLAQHGHRRILQACHLGGNCPQIEEKCARGFTEMITRLGLPHGKELEVHHLDQEIKGDFTAVFAAHDYFLKPLSRCAESFERQGKKFETLVFSNAWPRENNLELSLITSPLTQLADRAVKLLLQKIGGASISTDPVLLEPELVTAMEHGGK